jgi:hypothetical protein
MYQFVNNVNKLTLRVVFANFCRQKTRSDVGIHDIQVRLNLQKISHDFLVQAVIKFRSYCVLRVEGACVV